MSNDLRRAWLWSVSLVVAAALFSRAYGCGVPLAAVATIIGLALPFWPAACLAVLMVGLNALALGFAGWGWTVALGLITLVMVGLPRRLPAGAARPVLAFAVTFLTYEAGLYAAAQIMGGAGAFTPGQIWLGFLQNLVAYTIFWLITRIAVRLPPLPGGLGVAAEGRDSAFF